jgi:hypothetical protein
MSTLAMIIKDLDKECPSPDHSVFGSFSSALAKVVHSLISGGFLSDANQVGFLHSPIFTYRILPCRICCLINLVLTSSAPQSLSPGL